MCIRDSFKYLLNTHFHEDHISGLYWLMRYGFSVDAYLHPVSYTHLAPQIPLINAYIHEVKSGIYSRRPADTAASTPSNPAK